MSGPYAITGAKTLGTSRPIARLRKSIQPRQKEQKMKLGFRQRLRNWLFEEKESADDYAQDTCVSEDRFSSDGMRLQIYKGSGGFVVEVRNYDRKRDENNNKMYIIHDEKDLGEELGKIITMESLR